MTRRCNNFAGDSILSRSIFHNRQPTVYRQGDAGYPAGFITSQENGRPAGIPSRPFYRQRARVAALLSGCGVGPHLDVFFPHHASDDAVDANIGRAVIDGRCSGQAFKGGYGLGEGRVGENRTQRAQRRRKVCGGASVGGGGRQNADGISLRIDLSDPETGRWQRRQSGG